jgi:hypothetical protein
MKSKYETFDRSRLIVKPLAERRHDLSLERWMELDDPAPAFEHPELAGVARRLTIAREKGAARILMMGATWETSGILRRSAPRASRPGPPEDVRPFAWPCRRPREFRRR